MTRDAKNLVETEIFANVTGITLPLAQGYGHTLPTDLEDVAEAAFDVWTPIDDWESAAEEESDMFTYDSESDTWTDGDGDEFDTAREICEMHSIDPHQREVFESWAVSAWFGEKLEQHGERVTEVGGLCVWSRTTTGQAIYLDPVIEDIAEELGNR